MRMRLKTLHDLDVREKRVLVRVDYNVPLKDGKVADDTRIKATIPTIEYLREVDATVILISHLGRPNGVDEKLRMKPVAERLGKILKTPVITTDDCVGEDVEDQLNEMRPGEVALLENLRFHPEEELDDDRFARGLAELADCYVNDAFGVSHRAHASVHAITKHLPSAAGFLLEREVNQLDKLHNPERPFTVIMGGAKASDKIGVITALARKADALLMGGAMMFMFLAARGHEVGKSLLENDRVPFAKTLLKAYGRKIVLPVDVVVSKKGARSRVVPVAEIPRDCAGLDIGPKTAKLFAETISQSKTVFWNGPLGLVEQKPFDKGTNTIARAMAKAKATTVVGGGDIVAAIQKLKLSDRFTHVSTGGGAALEYIEGRKLPGITALAKI